jgi:hypothetical protein
MSCGTLFVPATKQDAQGFGSAISYGKRYGLQAALGIASEDDDGQAASKPRPAPVQQVKVTIDMEAAVDEMSAQTSIVALKECFAKWYKSAEGEQKETLKFMYDGIKVKMTATGVN